MEDLNKCPTHCPAERRTRRVWLTQWARPLRRVSRHRGSAASHPIDQPAEQGGRSRSWVTALVGACVALLGAALPAHATHFRYGTIDWVPAQPPAAARTIVFEVADAFRRAPTVNETSLAHCVNIAAANFASASLATCPNSPGDGYPGVGDVVREDIGGTQFYFGDCTVNSDCGTSGVCSSNQCTAGSTPGGRHVPTGSTPMFYVVTSIDVPNNWMYVQGLDPSTFGTAGAVIDTTISHTYPGTAATFTAGLDDGNRISLSDAPNAHINNPDYTYLVQATVNVAGTFAGNSSPVSTQVPIVNCPISTDAPCPPGIGATCSFTVPAVDPNGDTLFFRMSTAAEASRTAGFTQPGPPDSTFGASINSASGVYTWNTCGATLSSAKACKNGSNDGTSCTTNATCTGGGTCQLLTSLYSTQVIVEDRSGATVKSHIPVDFLIQLVPQVVNNHPPVFDHPATPACGSTQTVLAGNNLGFTVEASDPDAGDLVTLNVAGLPSGATMTPALPTTANPVSSAFSWTPSAATTGDFIVNFSATDSHNVQVTCPITIEVQCNVALCNDGNACTTDSCSAPLGICQHSNNNNACDDGNLCTTGDICQGGSCAGSPVVCNNGDQCNNAGTCDTGTGQCSPPVPHGGSCSDGSLCTTGDTCQAGACVGAPVICNNGDQCNDPGSCDAGTGQCSAPVPHGGACNDGSLCTTGDSCVAGACIGAPVVCTNGDQCNNPGTCQAATGQCSAPVPHGGACNDNSLCTTGDTCQAGVCTGAPVVCTNGDQCNNPGTCQAATGQCSAPVPHGGACNDNSLCTTGDTCQAGVCTGAPVVCANGDQCNNPGTCQAATGQCSAPVPHGGACNDNSLCTTGDTCQAGVCTGAPVVCTNGDQCNNPGTCQAATGQCSAPVPHGGSCNDNSLCTTGDTCQAGVCTGTAVTCPAPGVCRVQGTCDPANGQCSNPTAPNGTACSDGDACTQTDVCQAGSCLGINPVTCPAPGQCHVAGTCNPANGQCSNPIAPNDSPCSDGNACTQTDTCQAGSCTGANPVTCPAPTQCHLQGTCDPASGSCSNPTAPDGTVCNDNNTCSTGDQCVAGMCQGVSICPEICDDQIDNDGDGLIDCLDPDCPVCPAIVDTCHHPCVSEIVFENRGLDLLRLQASFKPVTVSDPATEQFGVLITDSDGVVFHSLLPPGTVQRAGKTYIATVKAAKTLGGIFKVKIITLVDGSYRVNIKGYAEMSAAANQSVMTVQVMIGNDVAVSTTTWSKIGVGWRAQLP